MFHFTMLRTVMLCAFCVCLPSYVFAQTAAPRPVVNNAASATGVSTDAKADGANPDMEEVRRLLREQQEELKRMRETINEQSHTIDELRQRVEHTETEQAGAPGVVKTGEIADGLSGQEPNGHGGAARKS
jgi:septal ring factor EnvC (AmiA/AmiB activator)